MREFGEGSNKESEQKREDAQKAFDIVDGIGRIQDSIDDYNMRRQRLEEGIESDADLVSYDHDGIYRDEELADRISNLQVRFEDALVALTALIQAERLVQERKDELKRSELHARVIAKKTLSAAEVTIADLFPSEVGK